MKIIQEGKDLKKQKYKGKCAWCKCKIECDGDEIKIDYENGDSSKDGPYVNCPTSNCFRKIFVKPKDKSLLD